MAEKKKQQMRILPPLEELIAGTTDDLVSEALKKVIPYPLDKKEKTSEQEQENKTKKKSSTRLQHTPVQNNLAISAMRSNSSARKIPGIHNAQLSHTPATAYPTNKYLITPHSLLDEVLPTLNAYEQVLLIRLYRLSYGVRRKMTDHVGKKTLAEKCNMSIAMVKKVVKSLEGRGLIKTIPDRSSDPRKGNKYKVLMRLSKDPVLSELSSKKAQTSHDPEN